MQRRTDFSSAFEQRVMSIPFTKTLPDVGRSKARICRNSVLLPEPLPPNSTMVSPCSMSRLSPSSIRRPSYSTTRSRIEMIGIRISP